MYGIEWLTPVIFTVLVALFTSLVSQIMFANFTNKSFITDSRNEIMKIQKRLKEMSPNSEDYLETQSKMLDINMQLMTHTMKPTFITMLPFLGIFIYVRSVVPEGPLIEFPFSIPFIGSSLGFVGVYFISSLFFSTIVRKILRR